MSRDIVEVLFMFAIVGPPILVGLGTIFGIARAIAFNAFPNGERVPTLTPSERSV